MTGPAVAPPAAEPARPAAWLGVALIAALIAAPAALAVRSAPIGPGLHPDVAAAGDPASPAAQRAMLLQHLARNPRDARGWVLLALGEFEAERFAESAQAFERAIAASPRVAADPAIWCEYADALGMAQGGSLEGRPTEAIDKALALRPGHPKALEMAGSAAYGRRDFAAAADHWRRLLPQIEAGTTARAQLEAAIERAERLAATSLRP